MNKRLSERFEDALIFATQLHSQQSRKGSQIPYIAHLMSVAALVLEAGGDEDLAISALLHDAVEDQGGAKMLTKIRQRFGKRIALIVEGCTDSYTMPKPPWKIRKENHLKHLKRSNQEVRLVLMADKLHNGRCILRDLRIDGQFVWDRFNGGKQGTLWYFHSMIEYFEMFDENFLLDELKRVVDQIDQLA